MYQWIVSFNDGQRISSKMLLAKYPKKNPWDYVINFLKKNKYNVDGSRKQITHLELIVNGIRYNGPSVSNESFSSTNGYSRFWVLQKAGFIFGDGRPKQDHVIGISYRNGSFRYILWVNEMNNDSHMQIINLSDPKTKQDFYFINIEADISKDYKEIEA